MSIELKKENVLIQIRGKLNENQVKLWLKPYYDEILGPSNNELDQLAVRYSFMLSIAKDYCLEAIRELQNNALEKLKARKEFEVTGVATLKARISLQNEKSTTITIKHSLLSNGMDFKNFISKEINVPSSDLKIIFSGKIIKDDLILKDQGITNNQQILVIISNNSNQQSSENIYEQLKKTREDAQLLMDGQNSMMQMEDQAGYTIHMPPNVKKQIMMALALHEKGRALIEKQKFNEALIFLLEADSEYSFCEQHWLNSVDNYAILNLDIVWCYLQLKSILQLPNAENRLKMCEEIFKKSYGEDMGRVVALKGTSENERALIMRLHLLQSILLFYQNRREAAGKLLIKAEMELKNLKVNEDHLSILIGMGYNPVEARIGLRSCANEINKTIDFILQKQEQRKNARKIGEKEKSLEKIANECSNDNEWVNPKILLNLVNMGYPKKLSAIALQKSKNDINEAIKQIEENKSNLMKEMKISEENIKQLENMGFHYKISETVLRDTYDDLNDAIEYLINIQSNGSYERILQDLLNSSNESNNDNIESPSTSKSSNNNNNNNDDDFKKNKRHKKEAYKRFTDDLNLEEDNYLDLPLEIEENIIKEYKILLNIK